MGHSTDQCFGVPVSRGDRAADRGAARSVTFIRSFSSFIIVPRLTVAQVFGRKWAGEKQLRADAGVCALLRESAGHFGCRKNLTKVGSVEHGAWSRELGAWSRGLGGMGTGTARREPLPTWFWVFAGG